MTLLKLDYNVFDVAFWISGFNIDIIIEYYVIDKISVIFMLKTGINVE